MDNLIVILDFLSRAMAFALAVGAALAFLFQSVVKGWIDAYFKRRVETELADKEHELALSLEEKKAALGRESEFLRSRLMEDLDKRRHELDDLFRRKQLIADRNLQYFEIYSTGYGTIFAELYALQENYFKPLEEISLELVEKLRKATVMKIHRLLVDTEEKLRPFDVYVDSEITLRVSKVFRELSSFLSNGARDPDQLKNLAMEQSMILVELRGRLFGEVESA